MFPGELERGMEKSETIVGVVTDLVGKNQKLLRFAEEFLKKSTYGMSVGDVGELRSMAEAAIAECEA